MYVNVRVFGNFLPDKSKALRCLLDYVEEKDSEWDEMFATIRCNRCG